jgi:hypothetical protein
LPSSQQRALQNHRNHYLFADYYLDHRLNELPEWRAADTTPVLAELRQLWASFTPHHDNEAQTEEEWIRPVLKTLGHVFNVQAPLKTPFGTRKPDYILYPDEAGRQAAKAKSGAFDSEELRAAALAVADAKAWDRPLDRAAAAGAKKGQVLSENPSLQIYLYVQHSGLAWGILTNGRLWRLVHRATAEKLDVYYEVDLSALLDQGDPEAFKYFYLFFRREAFMDQPGAPGWLSQTLDQSRAYARGISDSLRDQVYEALRHLAQGFLDFPANRLTPDPVMLKAIYDHSLIVLYRLLFILYAESRGLLPVPDNPLYSRSYSLDAMKKRLARELDHGQPAAPSMTTFWQQLRQLWQVIDSGNPDLDVPAYNGGLFKARPDAFLEQYQVGDVHLRQAIDLLARTVDPQTRRRVFVDYRDLEIRHLGSIYEGLLEYRVQVADQPLTVRVEKGKEIYTPSPEAGEGPGVGVGQVYLTTDKGERKATGSYYTPDYIVKYIVEQTVRPVLTAKTSKVRSAKTFEVSPGETDPTAMAQALLSVNVLDPSMGSGHFLVEAADFIARTLVELGLPPPADAAGESDLAYWRRRVAQNCIYGVDVNPLAVELAKLSLWLTTVARGKPLSFLDHHLRCGNSLVGSRVADLPLEGGLNRPTRSGRPGRSKRQAEAAARAAGQLSMLDDSAFAGSMRTAAGFMSQIETLASDTLAEVQQAEGLYRRVVEEVTARARQLADVWTARAFGLPDLDPAVWNGLARFVLHGGFELPQYGRILAQAGDLAARHRFFHWELEFPEVFFDASGGLIRGAGFDAVIGNPPYVRQEELSPLKPYFAQAYPEVYYGTADLFVYFFGRGLQLLAERGRLAYISSNSWLRANYATPLRAYLRGQTTVETLLDLGDNRVFADAPDLYPAIHVVRREAPPAEHTAQVAVFTRGEGLARFEEQVAAKLSPVSIHDQPDSGWQLDDAGRGVFAKLISKGRPLGEVVNGQMYYGIKTGLNDAFIIDQATRDRLVQEDPASAEIIKPILRGEDLRPWYQEDEGLHLIFTRRGINIDAYPAVKAYLQQFREQLEPRPKDWDAKQQWPGRKPGPYQWYEIQDSIDYYSAFEKPKIFWPDISKFPRFSWDTSGYYLGNTGYIVVTEDPWLLGFLASRCAWFLISRTSIALGERAGAMRYRLIDQYMRPLPIPDAPAAEREAIGGLAVAITEQARARYQLHRQSRHRLLADLKPPQSSAGLNQKLAAWWELDFPGLRAELQKVFKRDIPLAERDDWEAWLQQRRSQHQQLTAEIIRLETELNQRVYALFNLTPAEVKLIEKSTKYRYGEV